ncbi:phosphatase PAP2 family protein [Fontibacillus sp. BL9]|uniref:phosphatase PAP2 family protein n=1 Tax=Fontibacillus sp. BL9 TaxID=3389971 RepID=UPI00397CDFC5
MSRACAVTGRHRRGFRGEFEQEVKELQTSTSISITIAFLAVRSGNRRWGFFASISAVIIVFSIFYLGIHWLSDMLGGLFLAGASSTPALKWA